MKKFNLEPVKKFAIGVCKLAGAGLLIGTRLDILKTRASVGSNIESVDYYDAIRAIMNNDYMASSYKKEMAEILRTDAPDGYYRTVIEIVNNLDMASSYKIEIIEALSKR